MNDASSLELYFVKYKKKRTMKKEITIRIFQNNRFANKNTKIVLLDKRYDRTFFKTDQIEQWNESRFEKFNSSCSPPRQLLEKWIARRKQITNASSEFGVRFASGIVRWFNWEHCANRCTNYNSAVVIYSFDIWSNNMNFVASRCSEETCQL